MAPIRVLLADDHVLMRAGITALLQRIPDLTVVAEADDGRDALQLIATHHPDIAMLDISMPALN
jgi:DNA-binding NarL/FixJ family response regulator